MRQLDGIPEWLGRSLSKFQELVMDRKASPPQPPRLAYMEAYQTQFQQVWLSDFPAH